MKRKQKVREAHFAQRSHFMRLLTETESDRDRHRMPQHSYSVEVQKEREKKAEEKREEGTKKYYHGYYEDLFLNNF